MADDKQSMRGRPIPANTSDHKRTESTFSAASPSRASVTARLAEPIPAGSPSSQAQWQSNTPQAGEDESAPLAGATGTSVPGPGTSSLSQALRGELGRQSPPLAGPSRHRPSVTARDRVDSPDSRSQWESVSGSFVSGSHANQMGRSPRANGTEDIEILKRHLVNPSQPGSEPGSVPKRSGFPAEGDSIADNEEFSSLQLQGGDTTRHIYRYAEKRERELAENEGRGPGRLRRSFSVQYQKTEDNQNVPDAASIKVPGGFRRDHIRRAAGSPAPSSIHKRRDYGTAGAPQVEPERQQPQFVANNFIEFLTLYGHFAGEELAEDDEDLGPDEYFSSDAYDDSTADGNERRSDDEQGERSTLLPGRGRRKRKRKQRDAGKASPLGAAMLLLKSFVGTGVLFLPRAYLNGGMLFANLVLVGIALLSYYCFLLLVSVRLKVHASFGDMGQVIFGKWFKGFINFSLVISQIGFTSAYTVFTAENLQAFVLAVTHCRTHIDVGWFILLQTIIFLPVSLYRNINNIQKLALVADLFIALGLLYIYYYDVRTMVVNHGVSDIKNFNAKDWTLFIGTAIFTFEGIGLVIPIQSSMHDPRKFPKVLGSVMVIISVIFISAGAVSYAAYGSHTKTVILLNLPQDDKIVNAVQFLYSLAILFSTPLQIYPAIEITSQQLFSRTGKYNPWIKWQKNFFRFAVVIFCSALAFFGANDLDKFVALVGSFACIPLVYLYPPMMHYKIVATKSWQKVVNVLLVIFGFGVMTYTTTLTVQAWAQGHDKEPGYCDSL